MSDAAVFQALIDYMTEAVRDRALVKIEEVRTDLIVYVSVLPFHRAAAPLTLIREQFLHVIPGDGFCGGWELDFEDIDIELAREVIDAVITGRLVETYVPGYAGVHIRREDGRVERAGVVGAFGLPVGCRRYARRVRGPRVVYEPYVALS